MPRKFKCVQGEILKDIKPIAGKDAVAWGLFLAKTAPARKKYLERLQENWDVFMLAIDPYEKIYQGGHEIIIRKKRAGTINAQRYKKLEALLLQDFEFYAKTPRAEMEFLDTKAHRIYLQEIAEANEELPENLKIRSIKRDNK